MFIALVDLLIEPDDVANYIEFRRREINPSMWDTGAFLGTLLLRPIDEHERSEDGRLPVVLINQWREREAQRRFASSSRHVGQLAAMKALTEIVADGRYDRLDTASFDRDGASATVFELGRYRCEPGRGPAALAGWEEHIKNVRDNSECGAASVFADVNDHDSFVVIYRAAGEQAMNPPPITSPDIVSAGAGTPSRYSLVSQ